MFYKNITSMLLLAAMGALFFVPGCKNEYVQQDPVCFERDVYPIISSSCTQSGCHNAIDREKGRDYSTYEGILRDVKKGNYKASQLYQVLLTSMPPQPYNSLTDDQILTVATWIEEGATNDTCISTTICDTSGVISYTSHIKPLLQNWCNSCHGGAAQQGGGISLSSYAAVKITADDSRLMGSVIQNGNYSNMPKNGNKLSNCNIAILQKWVNEGAPNN